MSRVLRSVRKRKKGRTLGAVDVIDREGYAELEVDAKVELIRSLIPLGLLHIEELLDEEVTALAGERYARKDPSVGGRRHGSNPDAWLRTSVVVGQTPGATQRCLDPGFSERIGNSRRTPSRGGGHGATPTVRWSSTATASPSAAAGARRGAPPVRRPGCRPASSTIAAAPPPAT